MFIAIILFLLVFTLVALAHEFGHFIAAKKAGIRVYEFGLGFGPRLLSFERGGTIYSLSLLPILAFVKIAGTEDDAGQSPCPDDQKYHNKPIGSKFFVSFLGPAMNIFLAFIILTLIFTFIGVPKDISNEIERVNPGSPAESVGLRSGDKVLAIDNHPVIKMEESIKYIHQSSGKTLSLKIDRQGKAIMFKAAPKYDPKLKVGLLGFTPKPIYIKVNPLAALYYGVQQTLSMIALMFIIIWQLITGSISVRELAGPVGIAQVTGRYAQSGSLVFLHFLAFLNINIGVINLLPIPAMDGGRLVFVLIEAIRRKPVDPELENRIHQWGLIVLLGLMLLVTYNDILRILRPK